MAGTATRQGWWGAASIALFAACCPPVAAQTTAGTAIVNVAALRSDLAAATSNAVSLIVAERLDCALATAGDVLAAGAVLTNTGSGHEAFAVLATTPDGAAHPVAIDGDGDGRFDPAHDHLLTDGITPELPPGAILRLVVTGAAAADGVTITARAITGSGAPGTAFAGRGDGGGDAVVGVTGAMAHLVLTPDAPPTIVETQNVLAADGSAAVRRGSVVTYTLVARFVVASPAASLIDPVPDNAAYLPATLVLDDVAIGDTGRVADRRITVALGAVAAGSTHRLSFKAVIQ